MSLSSKNKCFCYVVARLYFVDLSSIFKEPTCKKPNLLGADIFSDYLPLTAMAVSCTQSGKKKNLWEVFFRWFLSAGRRVVDWHNFLCKNSFGYLLLPSKTYLHIFIDNCFLLFLFHSNVPSIHVLVFTGLYLAPPDGTNTCGFVFSSMASLQAHLLLNSAT